MLGQTLASPALEKLLPDPLPVPYQRPLTLCVELTDALVHLEWDVSNICRFHPARSKLGIKLLDILEICRLARSYTSRSEAVPSKP